MPVSRHKPWESGHFHFLSLWILALGEASHSLSSQTTLGPPCCEEAQDSHTWRPHGQEESCLDHTWPANQMLDVCEWSNHLWVDPCTPVTSVNTIWITDKLFIATFSKFLTHTSASKCFIARSFGTLLYAPIDGKNNSFSVSIVRTFIDIRINIYQDIQIFFPT